jgi:hypothetical protein
MLQRLGRLARMSADHNRFAVRCEREAAPNRVGVMRRATSGLTRLEGHVIGYGLSGGAGRAHEKRHQLQVRAFCPQAILLRSSAQAPEHEPQPISHVALGRVIVSADRTCA